MRFLAIATLVSIACSKPANQNGGDHAGSSGGEKVERGFDRAPPPYVPRPKRTTGRHATAVFAAGCFWCVEAIFEHVRGVDEAISGFSGGSESDPTYEAVALGKTTHAEAVEVHYDPDAVSYETLVRVLVGSMDPTQVDGQGPDWGRQYRSIIFYTTDDEKTAALEVLAKERTAHKKPLAIEIAKLEKFWAADDYHQDYEPRNPGDGYVNAVSRPRLEGFKKKFPELVRER